MPLIFEVNDETLEYTLEVIPPTETVGLDQAGLLKAVIEKTAKVRQYYDAVAARYGKLIGQGRTGLLELFDDLFTAVIVLNERFKAAEPDRFGEFGRGRELRVAVENRNNKFCSTGAMKDGDIALPNDFGGLYAGMIVERIRKSVLLAGKPAPSGELFEVLDALLYSFIVIRYNVLRCAIDR